MRLSMRMTGGKYLQKGASYFGYYSLIAARLKQTAQIHLIKTEKKSL
jgi:hypothetical protein